MKPTIVAKVPMIVAMMGVVIHFLGIIHLLKTPSLKGDIIMLVIDFLVAYGLFWRKKWGWYLAIGLFAQ
jgi:hypothetical protein